MRGKTDGDRSAAEVDRGAEEDVRGERGDEHRGESRQCHRDRGDGPRLDHHEQGPAVQITEQRRDALAQVDVLAAGIGEHRRQLAVGQRPHQRDHAGDPPHREQQPRGDDLPQDLGRNDVDPRADHRADHERRGVEARNSFHELRLRLLRRGHAVLLAGEGNGAWIT